MLKKNIRKYVKSNVEETLEQLNDMALARENIDPYKKSKTIFDKKRTFAVIAGQASQFIPIQKAIRRELNRLNIPTNYRLFLKGEDAKEACCRGAVVYKQSGQEWGNPAEIHGTYGFLNAVKSLGDVYCVLDTRELNDRVTVHHEFDFPSTYWLFFTPRAYYTINNHNHPTFFDGTTALIESFTDTKSFDVSFDQDTLSIIVNNKSGFKIATYGDINESIYPKVWPVYLEPEKE